MMRAVGVLANGAKVHRFTSIVREGLEFIDFDLFMVYLTLLWYHGVYVTPVLFDSLFFLNRHEY
jgi:hypothetical protein